MEATEARLLFAIVILGGLAGATTFAAMLARYLQHAMAGII